MRARIQPMASARLVRRPPGLAALRVGRPFADAGQDPADGFRAAGRGARGDQRVQHLQVHGSEPDINRGEIALAPGWAGWRTTEPLPGPPLVTGVSAEPELEVPDPGNLLRELAVQFPARRLVVSLPGGEGRILLGLFDKYPDQQVSRLDPRVVAILQQRDPLHLAVGEALLHLLI